MNRYKKQLIAAVVLSALAVIGTIMNSRQASAQDVGPHVTIDSPIPLPVTGSVTSTVTGTVGVTGTIGLASGASVHVNNTVADPVRVRNVNDAIQPFQATTGCNSPAVHCTATLFNVPAGKRAVIEYFSGVVSVGTGQVASMALTFGTPPVSHLMPQTSPELFSSFGTSWGQQLRLYADSGPITAFGGGSGTGAVSFAFSISGYLVDVPFAP
jgi:hypothetical protein